MTGKGIALEDTVFIHFSVYQVFGSRLELEEGVGIIPA